jgi:hypothetical protein
MAEHLSAGNEDFVAPTVSQLIGFNIIANDLVNRDDFASRHLTLSNTQQQIWLSL